MATLDLSRVSSAANYSDGDVENDLLALFSQSDCQTQVGKILQSPSWEQLYHLSPLRERLLEWYPFQNHARLLEVGAGCGALTGLFAKRVQYVTALELTERRARILHARHRELQNLEVCAGNLADFERLDEFDYVTSIGVLEYAGRFSSASEPYLTFLKQLAQRLKMSGTLILAIENRHGLKYWNGAKEDHTGRLFDSLEGYPNREGVRTFGKNELIELLQEAGFANLSFYYPFPDYKFADEIFSDHYPPIPSHMVKAGLFPAADLSKARRVLFNEYRAAFGLAENGLLTDFANSFLVFAERLR